MKVILILFVCFLGLNNGNCTGNNNLSKAVIDTPNIIKKIQTDFVNINSRLKFYKKKHKETFEMSAEGGDVTGYYDKGTLKKVHCIYYGEMGKAEVDYYFNEKGLFFLYKREIFYDKPMYQKDFKVKSTIETRYYINEKKIVKSISKPVGSAVLPYKEIEQEVKQIVNILNSK
ncbi:hypothetical protein [Pedobacter nototheniae]|uniref:hypothetical protein n=1 Tax=Pedobacter nototheniae TaxID=2488994 RepID=UPI00292E3BFF|nr:hypothetical protein [Pedobacter nototheniae]